MDYKFTLRSGSKHDICPHCQKLTFKPYVDGSNKVVGAQYGRCERVNSCGYTKYPKAEASNDKWTPPPPKPERPTEYIDKSLVEATFNDFKSNVFFRYLRQEFGGAVATELQEKYNIGTAKNGGTVFWQQDTNGLFRTAKVMYYNADGRRDKDRLSWFVHKKIRSDFNFKQCFFGLHLTTQDKPVALCESEKTAILMSIYEPTFNWIASGGSEMINLARLAELKRLDKVYPDGGQDEKWEQKTKLFNPEMDEIVKLAIIRGQLKTGSDILDLIQIKNDIQIK